MAMKILHVFYHIAHGFEDILLTVGFPRKIHVSSVGPRNLTVSILKTIPELRLFSKIEIWICK